jgi:hypothetical protein
VIQNNFADKEATAVAAGSGVAFPFAALFSCVPTTGCSTETSEVLGATMTPPPATPISHSASSLSPSPEGALPAGTGLADAACAPA